MPNITELELQNLKHLIDGHDTISHKLEQYASVATDPEVKQYFTKSSQCAADTKQKLMTFLQ
ncbi:MAG: hypothetical protein K0R15_111 [Clostridiales bacterium]|jgi:truncated hemoglobin YjbI|nr:hypothetical protein [Clostridiales bacterium]